MQNCKNQTIAIIDSGIGGVSVLKQLINRYKSGNYIYFADNQYMPYGNKSKSWLKKRVDYIINILKYKYNVKQIIVACNTASSVIEKGKYKNVYIMSFKDKKVYLTTKLTKKCLSSSLNVISEKMLAKKIEKYIFDKTKLMKVISQTVKKHNLDNLKQLTLGCTHYELVKPEFERFCPKTKITNNSEHLISDIKLNQPTDEINISIVLSKKSLSMENKILKLIKE